MKRLQDDNGKGLPKDFQEKKDSLGMTLIRNFSQQLNADYDFDSSNGGTVFAIKFSKN